MKITLVRHGETEENYQHIVQGTKNSLLNESGRRQCLKLKAKISDKHYDYCYMSPLIRTVETAMILIGDRVEMIPDKRLVERTMGDFEGKSISLYDANSYWDYDLNKSDNGVESIQDIFHRCQDFLNYIFEKNDGQDIMVVTHGAPYRALRHLILHHDLDGNLMDTEINNCSMEEFEV